MLACKGFFGVLTHTEKNAVKTGCLGYVEFYMTSVHGHCC